MQGTSDLFLVTVVVEDFAVYYNEEMDCSVKILVISLHINIINFRVLGREDLFIWVLGKGSSSFISLMNY